MPDSASFRISPVADLILFSALTPADGWELWKSDGTTAGTALVGDLAPGPPSSDPYGTVAVGDIACFFAGSDGRVVLWSSDGTAEGTSVVDPLAATDGFGGTGLAAIGDALYFAADDGTHGPELWVTRPGQAAAAMVRDLLPGSDGAAPALLGAFDGQLIFAAAAGDGVRALWRSDGTAAGTERLTGIDIAAADARGVAVGDLFYFIAEDPSHGGELWRTDGTASGTLRVTDLAASPAVGAGKLAALDGAVYFAATTADSGEELWRFDGESAAMLADIRGGAEGSLPGDFVVMGGVLYFTAADGVHGRELWRTDGTAEGTRLVADIADGAAGSRPSGLVAAGGRIFLAADDGTSGLELWASDGTGPGTVRVADIHAAAGGSPHDLVVLEGPPPVFDAIPPDTSIVSGPPPVDMATTAQFDFASDEAGVTYEAALDDSPWQAMDDPATLAGLAAGSHTLRVRAIDQAGNVDPTPARYDWAVGVPSADTIAPDTTILSGPPANGAGQAADFVFGSDEDQVAYQVSVDGGPFLTVLNPLAMQGLAPGAHALLARAVDPSGNVDATPAAWSWFVGDDTVMPDTLIASGPAAAGTAPIAVFDLAATEAGVRFEARLDGADWQAVRDPVALFGLAAGGHTFQARAIDAAGNADASPVSWSWTVDPASTPADPGPAPVAGGAVLVAYSHADADALLPDAGIRWVHAHASLRLPDGVANLALLGDDGLNGEGNALPNLLLGNVSGNVLLAHDGRDSVVGEGGADFLAAGRGDDTVWGDDAAGLYPGDDTVWGGQGNDSILGGGGRDLLNGDRGADTLLGGGDGDTVNGGADGDRLEGGAGADLLRGGQGCDLLLGGAGADTLAGDLGADTLWGGEGRDIFVVAADGAIEVVADFATGIDRLQVSADTGIIDEATFRARAHDDGEGTLLELGPGSWVVVLGVRPAQLSIDDLQIL